MDNKPLIALGRIAAIERVIGALIATHSTPHVLAAMWTEVCPQWREDLKIQYPSTDDAALVKATGLALDRFEQSIHASAAVRGIPQPG